MKFPILIAAALAVLSLGAEWPGRPTDDSQVREGIELFTDRSVYRPGQEIRVKGIAYHIDPETRDFRTLEGAKIAVWLRAPNEKRLAKTVLKTNRWGSFAVDLAAPTDGPTGWYRVVANFERPGAGEEDGDDDSGLIAFALDPRLTKGEAYVRVEEYTEDRLRRSRGWC